MENHQTQSKPEGAEQPSPEGLSSSVLFAQALQRRKDHLIWLISDTVTASGGKISDDLLPHMEARKAIDTLLDYFGANAAVEARREGASDSPTD